ncbi:MAG: ABC transporter permease, partial [Streptococcus mitis]|nr:ABC transporter permease [Streptococcus mitis]
MYPFTKSAIISIITSGGSIMKKKPIYLWVLLILSALISATSLFELLKPLP